MKVLAIDDQQLVLLPLQKRLLNLGYNVKIETNASKGLELFNSFSPDLVIVDINMPEVSGLEVVKHIRYVKASQTPIMILSGNEKSHTIVHFYLCPYGICTTIKIRIKRRYSIWSCFR
jgi:DNA-binding response OmpR family regulator